MGSSQSSHRACVFSADILTVTVRKPNPLRSMFSILGTGSLPQAKAQQLLPNQLHALQGVQVRPNENDRRVATGTSTKDQMFVWITICKEHRFHRL